MLPQYLAQANLLTKVIPLCFESAPLALKGGTAINLFVTDLPRLSVDLDCVYVDRYASRIQALEEIDRTLHDLHDCFTSNGLKSMTNRSFSERLTKLVVSDGSASVKIEINPVHRGVLLVPEMLPFCPKAQSLFSISENIEIPVLARDELYAGKLVAALDRQHPRDLFDVAVLMHEGGITDVMLDCFTVVLACSSRPCHEVLAGNDRDLSGPFESSFVGLTDYIVNAEDLNQVRTDLRYDILTGLGRTRFEFLYSLLTLEPRWDLMPFDDLDRLPAIKWKLTNLDRLRDINPDKFASQHNALADLYDQAQQLSRGRLRPHSR